MNVLETDRRHLNVHIVLTENMKIQLRNIVKIVLLNSQIVKSVILMNAKYVITLDFGQELNVLAMMDILK